MPIMSVIKNDAFGDMLCSKIPCEDFNIGSQLIVTEYEEALFMKDGIIEQVFTAGKYTLTTENYPFLTKLMSKLLTGGVSAYNCKIYYINKSHHLELKWGTGTPIRILDPVWGIEVHVQARGAYTAVVKDGKKFFLKMVGANVAATENDIVKNFRTAFIQHISDTLADYLTNKNEEVLVTCNKKKALADEVKVVLNEILDEYGMELVNFYIESIEIPENDSCMQRIREMRIQRQEKMFEREQNIADERMRFGLRQESAETDRYVSGQHAQADYERMKIRDQDGNNGWARQETAEIMRTIANNNGMTGTLAGAGMGLGMGATFGNMAASMFANGQGANGANPLQATPGAGGGTVIICPKCNAIVPEGMKFCGECGSPVEKPKNICPSCGAEVMAGMKFCGECGQPMIKKRTCTNCGAEIPDGMKFCGECGSKAE